MKKKIHPLYREVVFHDISCDHKFIIFSSIITNKRINYNNKTYPLVKIETSSFSHPFYTGKGKIVDIEGRIEKFNKKFNFFNKK